MYFLNLFFISVVLRRTGVIKHRWRGAGNAVVLAEDIAPRSVVRFQKSWKTSGCKVAFFFLFPLWVFPLLPSSCSWIYLFVSSLASMKQVAPGSPAADRSTVAQPRPLGHCDALGLTPPLPEPVSAAVVRQRWEENPSINSAAAES